MMKLYLSHVEGKSCTAALRGINREEVSTAYDLLLVAFVNPESRGHVPPSPLPPNPRRDE